MNHANVTVAFKPILPLTIENYYLWIVSKLLHKNFPRQTEWKTSFKASQIVCCFLSAVLKTTEKRKNEAVCAYKGESH